MPFTNTVLQRFTTGGECWEHGTWEMVATPSGIIVPATLGQGISGGIREIMLSCFWSDANHELAQYLPSNMTYVKVTDASITTGTTTGRYTLMGRMA